MVATIKKSSDVLTIFLLKAHNPEKYRDNSKVELSGSLELHKLSEAEIDQELAELAALEVARRVAAPAPDDFDDLV